MKLAKKENSMKSCKKVCDRLVSTEIRRTVLAWFVPI